MQIYYYEGEDRRGPVNPVQLKTLAASGRVTPETIVEVGDKRLPARKVKGLEFPAAAPPVVPPAAPADDEIYTTAAPVPPVPPAEPAAVKTETKLPPFGAVQVEVPVDPSSTVSPVEPVEPAAPGLSDQERTQRELRIAVQNLVSSCVALKAVGWFFYIGAAVSLFGGLIAAANTENFSFVCVAFAGLAAGWAAAQVPFALEKIGQVHIAQYNADLYRGK